MTGYLDFEKNVAELERKLQELRAVMNAPAQKDSSSSEVAAHNKERDAAIEDIEALEAKAKETLARLYSNLTPWQKINVARHPERIRFSDVVENVFRDFVPLAGDRYFGEDQAIVGGPAQFGEHSVMVIGHEKGHDTQTRIRHNFGMAMPEGYRKAIRLMNTADRFNMPVITIIDTAGAYPGIGAEERGQAEAIARSIDACMGLGVPSIAVVIGEGGSGGAVAIATSSKVLMLEHAIYTVASPEASASILWHDSSRAKDAAQSMKITAQDLYDFKVIDKIIEEPVGGAHRDPDETLRRIESSLKAVLDELVKQDRETIVQNRRDKFLSMGTLEKLG